MSRGLLSVLILLGSSAFADVGEPPAFLDKYFSASQYEIEELMEPLAVETTPTPTDECTSVRPQEVDLGAITDGLDKIIAIGEKIWKLVEAGRPVVTFKAPMAHALPQTLPCWGDLERWSFPKSQVWQVSYKNGFNTEVVRFKFRITYTAGGSFEGKGKYLANVTVQPADVQVKWGFNFDAQTVVGRAINLGTKADPLAGLQLTVSWNVKSWMKESLMTETFFISGDGGISKQ